MCCFHLHFSYFDVLFKKNCCSLLLKKITCCAKREKNNLSRGRIPAPLWISNGPSLNKVQNLFTVLMCVLKLYKTIIIMPDVLQPCCAGCEQCTGKTSI